MLQNKDIVRFWSNVKKSDGCWEWQKSCQRTGYGQFCINRGGTVTYYTHRLAYELTKGKIPEGLFVCHTCDNRKCCNPEHLYVGTQFDNMRDMRVRQRGAGLNGMPPATKLTVEQVKEIKEMLKSGVALGPVAEKFGVTKANICSIGKGQTWAWVE